MNHIAQSAVREDELPCCGIRTKTAVLLRRRTCYPSCGRYPGHLNFPAWKYGRIRLRLASGTSAHELLLDDDAILALLQRRLRFEVSPAGDQFPDSVVPSYVAAAEQPETTLPC